ncbi:hypothetical protein HID58_078803 [Brassica napus]|uniref:(rape) hypothetical protein n=1 Tax=Brassica napus TaxID=3708 RepID=A0A816N936_BRANA|nr:hypothetical protein HID58_090566 [Brassica napus]KAH0871781.1 hypothetical protein HID58_078803 [Brassica napus]CAF2032728.1 unnamed protein product [Brassica napus]
MEMLLVLVFTPSFPRPRREDKTRAIETLWWLAKMATATSQGVLDSLLAKQCSILDIWLIKDCDKALQLIYSKELAAMENTHELSNDASKASKHSGGTWGSGNGSAYKEKENVKSSSQINGSYESCNGSDLHDNLSESSVRLGDLSIIGDKLSSKPGSITKLSLKDEARCGVSGRTKINKKCTIARISETHSISVDFRISRGIAQVNEGHYMKAISIFDKALIGRGTAYAFQRELENAITDFTKAIESNPAACEAWKRRGQARAALGEFAEVSGSKSSLLLEEAHSKSIQLDSNYLEAWLHLAQHYQELADHHKAMECTEHALQVNYRMLHYPVLTRVWKAYHLRGLAFHGLGEHRKAIQELSIGLSIENSIECLYLRGSCYHAVGEYRDAVKDYDATVDVELDAVEKFVLQCLAFYQVPRDVFFVDNPEKEIALYTASKASSEFSCFDIDGDLDQMFKIICLSRYFTMSTGAKGNGKKARRKERINMLSHNRGGAGCSTSSSSETSTVYASLEDRSSGRSILEVYSSAVRWRQISEPCDPVVWVNKLSEEFNSGFGSDTPMVLGQAKVVRYFPNYERYNFMPLARGIAVTGFIVLLGLLLAANMEFTESIPKGLQMEWEALLNVEPGFFVGSVKSWLYPSLKINTSWRDHPEVSSAFSTTGSVVAALSTYND